MKNTLIKEMMSERLITLHPKNKISTAKEIFESHHIHHIPVVINSTLVGVLSLGDILAKENRTYDPMLVVETIKNISMLTIDEIMTRSPISIGGEDKIEKALEIMKNKHINCLPVVDEDKLIGILTSSDILKLLLEYVKK